MIQNINHQFNNDDDDDGHHLDPVIHTIHILRFILGSFFFSLEEVGGLTKKKVSRFPKKLMREWLGEI